MATPPVLDAESFVDPIPGDDPAGARIRSRLLDLNQIKEWQKDVDPERDGSSEPGQPPIEKIVPQPTKVIEFAAKYLKQTGKDLEVALYLTEALTKAHKFAGLRDGLRIIRRICETCWGTMHPVIDDPAYEEDVRGRTDLFAYLTEPDNRPYFPRSVRLIPLFKTSTGVEVSFQACQPGQGKNPVPLLSREDALTALRAGGPPRLALLQTYLEDIEGAKTELRELGSYLDTAAAVAAPGFTDLRKALDDGGDFIAGAINAVGGGGDGGSGGAGGGEPNTAGGSADQEFAAAGGGGNAGGGGPATALGAVRSREDVYRRLQELLGLLTQYDPHSPVPHLIRRAIEMKDLDFPQLIDVLTKEAGVMNFLRSPVEPA